MKQSLPVSAVQTNDGQIPGLPKNPRLIRNKRFEQLKQSIQDFPEMLDLREIVVFPHGDKFVCIGGNMRYLACKELGHEQIPVKVLPADFPIEKLKEFVIKDNRDFGEDDLDALANEWNDVPLTEWGLVDLPDMDAFTPNLDPEFSHRQISADDIVKTKEQLDEKFQDPEKYVEVICPHCAETFWIKPE